MEVLDEAAWRVRAAAHASRVEEWTAAHLARRERGRPHPVHDFLFTYYSQRPAQLRRWHPGAGVLLRGGAERAGRAGYAGDGTDAWVDPAYVDSRRPLLVTTRRLLSATAARPARLGCFGLHEWAMVYRLGEEETRHAGWPLRLGHDGTDRVVETHRIACSHFDAFRFFTRAARPLNTLAPGREDRVAFEQPGCLHGTMDLYKHAFRLSPMVPSELVADCFALAREVRVLDMRASPYDFSGLGLDPVPVETPGGKHAYATAQRDFAERAAPLRQRLVDWCDRLLPENHGAVGEHR